MEFIMKKINVIISEESEHAIADCKVYAWYKDLLNSAGDSTVHVASGVQINQVRLGVRLGEVEPFAFEFKGQTIQVNDQGQFSDWPLGLYDEQLIQMNSLMRGMSYEDSLAEHKKESQSS
jgi:predicted ATPase